MQARLIVTIDVVLFTLKDGILMVVLNRRDKDPYANQLALPGGYIHPEEDADSYASAERVLHQKMGIRSPYLEQLYTFTGRVRDPRGWSTSITYYALVNEHYLIPDEGHRFELCPVDRIPDLPFDHSKIVHLAIKRLRDKSTYSSLPCHLLPRQFTLSELQQTYEHVLGSELDKSVFRRKLNEMNFLEIIPNALRQGKHRPAQLYRLKMEALLTFFDKKM